MKTLRQLFRKLPIDGDVRHKLRNFNLLSGTKNKAASVKALAKSLGVDVRQVRLPIKFAGRLVQDPFSASGFAIEVNDRHSVQSRRFTVLHELGHMLLGHVDSKDIFAEPAHLNRGDEEFYFDVQKEREANDFADVLLFGDGSLEAAFSLYRGDRKQLAHAFGVSVATIEVAIRKYGVENRSGSRT